MPTPNPLIQRWRDRADSIDRSNRPPFTSWSLKAFANAYRACAEALEKQEKESSCR